MSIDTKKKIAAIMGVSFYLEQEKKEQQYQSQQKKPATSLWASYGRQTSMQMRNLVQRRLMKRK